MQHQEGLIYTMRRRLRNARREIVQYQKGYIYSRRTGCVLRRKSAVSKMSHLQYQEGHVCCNRRRLSSVRIKLCSMRRE